MGNNESYMDILRTLGHGLMLILAMTAFWCSTIVLVMRLNAYFGW